MKIHKFQNIQGSYQDLATTKFGSRSFEAIWNAAGPKYKMDILDELCYKDGAWSHSPHGKIISSKVHLQLYKRNKEEWKSSFNNKKEEIIKEIEKVLQ